MDGPPILQTILLDPQNSEVVFSHKSVRAVTFTGSTEVGRKIAELSGRYLKKTVLELGGSDACVVDSSANVSRAAEIAVKGRLLNNGQSCIASKRFFVPDKMVSEFMNCVQEELKSYVIGDPLDKKTRLGPLAHKKFYQKYHEHFDFLKKRSIAQTNDIAIPDAKGYFVSPCFFQLENQLTNKQSELYQFFQQQEVFSPLAMLTTYENEEQLIELVNDSPYGLGGVWIGDQNKFKAENLHLKFDVGMIAVNDILKSDARVPFGGVKDSGFGRESGEFGIREFCNTQWLGIS
jgi:succinate-semialdehyde dehydrogenase/glutarate-semialdehyde dehydrogenase